MYHGEINLGLSRRNIGEKKQWFSHLHCITQSRRPTNDAMRHVRPRPLWAQSGRRRRVMVRDRAHAARLEMVPSILFQDLDVFKNAFYICEFHTTFFISGVIGNIPICQHCRQTSSLITFIDCRSTVSRSGPRERDLGPMQGRMWPSS